MFLLKLTYHKSGYRLRAFPPSGLSTGDMTEMYCLASILYHLCCTRLAKVMFAFAACERHSAFGFTISDEIRCALAPFSFYRFSNKLKGSPKDNIC
mmetsp:Transcript_28021/g.39122  ORF Transcript_28021/g.39122 Transcript_28021/m.39122 type:complete len:96 (-) Transcript_28021:562-849(-)